MTHCARAYSSLKEAAAAIRFVAEIPSSNEETKNAAEKNAPHARSSTRRGPLPPGPVGPDWDGYLRRENQQYRRPNEKVGYGGAIC